MRGVKGYVAFEPFLTEPSAATPTPPADGP
jgi:hypothetical protein